MEKVVCACFDQKAKVFSNPFFSTNNATAIRDFERAVNDNTSGLYAYSDDYSLYHLGSFDDLMGTFTCPAEPQLLCLAVQLKKEV